MSALPDRQLLLAIAAELGVDPSLVEKDWQAVRVVAVVQGAQKEGWRAAFCGGTSLSKGYGLVKRFSEDLDFRLFAPGIDPKRSRRRSCREALIEALRNTAEWTIREEDIQVRNASRTFKCEIAYPFVFDQSPILRRKISLDVTFGAPAVSPEERPVRSFVAEARRDPPEVPSIACMAPVEIAAEKLSALTWRVLTPRRGIGNDDPALVRHLHDLAALKHHAADHPAFSELVTSALEADADRGDSVVGLAAQSPSERVSAAVATLATDPEYRDEYALFVAAMCYGAGEAPAFDSALAAVRHLGQRVG